MLHTIVASFVAVIVVVGGFFVISLIRDKTMGPGAPRYFAGCDSCRAAGSDCASCASAADCPDANKAAATK